MSKPTDSSGGEYLDEARAVMEDMIGMFHPADRPTKWRDLAEFANRCADAVEKTNERFGVLER